LPAGVDHTADQALIAFGDTIAGGHHAAECCSGRAEPDEHHRGEQRVVALARR
jgi:hypothetical protein